MASTYTIGPITEEAAKDGSQHLTYSLADGGAKKFSKLLHAYMKKHDKSIVKLAEDVGVSKCIFGRYVRGQNTGIALGTLRKVAKVLGMTTVALGKRIVVDSKNKAKGASTHKQQRVSNKLSKLMAALGVDRSELACSFTIGEDRITVERMAGQEGQPVVVEHNGHRLTVEKV